MRIDAHQHFWRFDPVRDSWITEDMMILRQDFMPEDLAPLLAANSIDGSVVVQADQSEEETRFLLQLSNDHSFIKGVVGWVDLCAEDIEDRLDHLASFKNLKGFRHIIQAEPENDFILRPDFCHGISKLRKHGFTYDLLILPSHLTPTLTFIHQFPDQPFVIDHLAKPLIRKGEIQVWREDITKLAASGNVYCKLSGMVTEADLNNWKAADFKPYIDTVIESFGTDRVMFGSDWPVCLLGSSYDQCCSILEENTSDLSSSEKEKLWGSNAAKFYKIAV